MDNKIINFDIEEADNLAIEYFKKICGFDRAGEKYERMLKEAINTRDTIRSMFNICAIVSSFSGKVIEEDYALINGIRFECNAFRQIKADSLKKVYTYIITIGKIETDGKETASENLYKDAWGTAYIAAAVELLKKYIKKEFELFSFGPGYYGMEIQQISNFFKILSAEKIGVSLSRNGFMMPPKSLAGIFVEVEGTSNLPSTDCESCIGGDKNCNYCSSNLKLGLKTTDSYDSIKA